MPELAEVEFYRRRWDVGLGAPILGVRLHEGKRIFRGEDLAALRRTLIGARLVGSSARGKQMIFRFAPRGWLGIHLGMTGRLHVRADSAADDPGEAARGSGKSASASIAPSQEVTRHTPGDDPRHDHLVLEQAERRLVFSDPRLFGRVRFHSEAEPPSWWRNLPPELLSAEFTASAVAAFLARRARSPIKAVLLMQERFPGIGNWMADEILWRAGIHPRRAAGTLDLAEVTALWRETRVVARGALRALGAEGRDLPRGWLFHCRWDDGRLCPRTGAPLVRESIGGRTTCWSPGRQADPRPRRRKRRTSS